jgi:erythromycin esterase-like protein
LPEQLLLADFKVDKLASAPEKSLPWYLSKAKQGNIFLDLEAPIKDSIVEDWLNKHLITRVVSWIYLNDPSEFFMKVNLKEYFDGILFIEKTTRARPTKNALVKASNKEGF